MKAKKLFPDLSFKRLWDKIKDLESKVEQGGSGSDSGTTIPQYKEQSGIVSQFTTTPGDGADDMYIEFPEVFDTVPTDFVCVDVEQSNMFTFTVKELTRSYAIVTVKSSLSYNSINDFSWKAVAYSGEQNKKLTRTLLWENSNPTADFAKQTVTLKDSLLNYEFYEIITLHHTSDNFVDSTGKIEVGYDAVAKNNSNILTMRTVKPSSDGNAIEFSQGNIYTTYNVVTADNKSVVPLKIYGYK